MLAPFLQGVPFYKDTITYLTSPLITYLLYGVHKKEINCSIEKDHDYLIVSELKGGVFESQIFHSVTKNHKTDISIAVTWHGVGGVSGDCDQMIATIK